MQQVAAIGKIKVEDLINMLRKLVGQDCIESSDDFEINREQPTWYKNEKVTKSFDVREMLARGEHPVNQVISDLSEIGSTGIYELIASFLPVPLIEKASSLNFEHWVKEGDDNSIRIYFFKL